MTIWPENLPESCTLRPRFTTKQEICEVGQILSQIASPPPTFIENSLVVEGGQSNKVTMSDNWLYTSFQYQLKGLQKKLGFFFEAYFCPLTSFVLNKD